MNVRLVQTGDRAIFLLLEIILHLRRRSERFHVGVKDFVVGLHELALLEIGLRRLDSRFRREYFRILDGPIFELPPFEMQLLFLGDLA